MPAKVAHLIFDFAVATQFEKTQIRVNYAGSAVVPRKSWNYKIAPFIIEQRGEYLDYHNLYQIVVISKVSGNGKLLAWISDMTFMVQPTCIRCTSCNVLLSQLENRGILAWKFTSESKQIMHDFTRIRRYHQPGTLLVQQLC